MNVLCEMALDNFVPELSYGSHFFQDIVESDIFYCALFGDMKGVDINLAIIFEKENQISAQISGDEKWEKVIRLVEFDGLELYSDIQSQRLICCKKIK